MSLNVSEMVGKTFVRVIEDGNCLKFYLDDGSYYLFSHYTECCERVYIEDIVGDLGDLVGSPLVCAEERTSGDFDTDSGTFRDDLYLWTFYEFATIKGSVTVRWYGSSNGYYSVGVDLEYIRGGLRF